MPAHDETDLSLHEAAEFLGVHYMTAYRYVRQGLLSAQKRQGTWRVSLSDLESFGGESSGADRVPTDNPAAMGRGRSRNAPWAQRLERRLVAGDDTGAWSVVESALAAGHDLESIYATVVSPALEAIGARWEAGELEISVEHQATSIATRLIARVGPRFARRGRSRGVVVIGAPAGEAHSLPTAMLGDLLRASGWTVTELGANTPAESFAHAAAAGDAVVAVGISVTHPDHRQRIPEIAAAVHERVPGLLIAAGGQGLAGVGSSMSDDQRNVDCSGVVIIDSTQAFLELLDRRGRQRLVSGG
jgi:excisionase family DNA binding protein